MSNYKFVKNTVIGVSALIILLFVIFTFDIINDEPDWAWFDVDFDNAKVANYGTLISGLLSFLAVLFVIFGIAEEREKLLQEKLLKKKDEIENYRNRLKLLKSLLVNITNEIKEQGERMKSYFELELENPTQPNMTYFSANKSFNRVLEMDYSINYLAIQYFFKGEEDWEKMFLNLNSFVDFYSECLIEHRQKYQNHIQDKVHRHKEINDLCMEFLDLSAKQIERYRVDFGAEYLIQKWVVICNEFIPVYYEYLEECKNKQEPTNFRVLSDQFFLIFLEEAMILRNEIGFDTYSSEELVRLAVRIRKKIYEVEMYSIQYAENVKYYYEEYFDKNSKDYKNFEALTEKIARKVEVAD